MNRNREGAARSTCVLVLIVVCAIVSHGQMSVAKATLPLSATPLRVDINSEARADMRTLGWENWHPTGGNMSQSFGDITVTLRPGGDGSEAALRKISIQGNKPLLVHGVTVGAEGAVVTGGKQAVMEIKLDGLTPGPHSFVGYHHALGGNTGTYTISAGDHKIEGNIMEGVTGPEGPTGTFKGMKVRGQQDAPVTIPKPFFEHYVKTHSAEEAYENVLADVGCNVPALDDHDKRVIEETRTGTTTYKGSKSGWLGLPDSQEDVGGWEDYPEIHRPADWDTDGDGMPNKWETEKGLNPNTADGAADPDGDGYTNLENYLNWRAAGNTLR